MSPKRPSLTSYEVFEADTPLQLASLVKEMIKGGWQPVGGMVVYDTTHYHEDSRGERHDFKVTVFAQTMVLRG